VAEKDTTLFRDETLSFHQALSDAGAVVELVDYPGLDHFSVIENLRDESYDLVQRLLRAARLSGAHTEL
jgi:acetyl esterase/lipase